MNIKNPGISFGLFADTLYPSIFKIIIGIIIIFLIIWFNISKSFLERWGLIIVIAGAFGNYIDRLISGVVTDFIYFYYSSYYWPAFNIADIAISLGVFILIIATYKNYRDSVIVKNE